MSLSALEISAGILIWGIAVAAVMAGTFLTLRHFGQEPPRLDARFDAYPVSILKPLKGMDSRVRENLESFFQLDYPAFELLFSVADARDPAASLARELMAAHPHVKARLFIGEIVVGPNPKVNNLVRSYGAAAHDWVLISDSNVRVERDYLKRQVAHLAPGVGMVTAVVTGRQATRFGGKLEATFLNTFYARWMTVVTLAGQPCVVGKSMLFRRDVADRFGGIRILGQYLAEDFMAGEAMRRLGLRVLLASDPINQVIGDYRFSDFWSRHIRWGRIRKSQAPLAFVFEPLLGCLGSGLIGAISFSRGLAFPFVGFLVIHLLIWSCCDFMLMRKMAQKTDGKMDLLAPLHWFARELIAFPLWLHIASGNTVLWRGHRLTLQPGGMLAASERP